MQKLFIVLSLLGVSCWCLGQETYTDKFYRKFKSHDNGGESFFKPALSLNACFSDSDNGGWFKKIVQFRVLMLDEKTAPSLRQEWDGLVRALGKDEYEDLVTFRQGKDYFRLMIKDVREGLKDVVLLSAGKDGSCLFVDLRGRFTADEINKIQTTFNEETASVR